MFHTFIDDDGDLIIAYIPENLLMMLFIEEMFQTTRQRRQIYTPMTDRFMKGWSKRALKEHHSTPTTLRSPISAIVAPYFDLRDGRHADVVIGAQGVTPLYAHKVILCSWSSRLRKMILREEQKCFLPQGLQKGARSSNRLLHIETVEEKDCAVAFKDFIQFMYTETITLSLQTVWAHITLAYKYNVQELLWTCYGFIFKRVKEMTMGRTLKDAMTSARSHPGSKGVVQVTMQRLTTELFLYEDDTVTSMDVDLLCDVLRSSSVVAISEFNIFQKLKPKLSALKQEGKHGQILRILSLLRLTQMRSSELREFVSSDYMDDMRKAFPGKLQTALWIHSLYSEQEWEKVPVNTEQTRLYFENQAVSTGRYFHNSAGTRSRQDGEDKVQANVRLGDVVLLVREGQQRVKVNKYNHNMATLKFPVYRVSTGHHGVEKYSSWTLELPPGKFPAVTVHFVRPRTDAAVNCRILLALYKTKQGQLDPKPEVVCCEGKDFTGLRKECTIDSLPMTGEEVEISVRVVGYAYDRGRGRFHHAVNSIQWLSDPPVLKDDECLGAAAKVVTSSDHTKASKRKPKWVQNNKTNRKRKGKRKDTWW